MTIEFTCQQCDNSLIVGSENAGKTSRCPRCGTPNVVPFPATSGENIPVAPVKTGAVVPVNQPTEPVKRFFVDTDFGQTYGPVTQTQLDQWVTEGRVTAQYVIREEGAEGGFYANQMYPALAEGPVAQTDPQHPAGAHFRKNIRAGEHAKAVVQPTRVDLGDVLSHAWRVFQNNMGLLLGTTITLTILSGISNAIDRATDRPLAGAMYFALLIAWLVVNASSLYLSIGMAQICLNLGRGMPASVLVCCLPRHFRGYCGRRLT